nr:hypothetical protein [Leptospira alstonii]
MVSPESKRINFSFELTDVLMLAITRADAITENAAFPFPIF